LFFWQKIEKILNDLGEKVIVTLNKWLSDSSPGWKSNSQQKHSTFNLKLSRGILFAW